MINTTVIRQTIREAFAQPALLFSFIIMVALVGLFTFGISLDFQNDILVSMKLFGKEIEVTHLNTFFSSMLESMSNILSALLMFLFIVGSSYLYPSMLQDPLLGITLTKPISRTSLFLSKFAGFVLAVALSMILFSVFVWLILFSKSGGHVSGTVIIASMSFCFEFIVVFALCSLVAMIVENATGVALLGIGIYYVLSPLMASMDQAPNLFTRTISLLLPPIGKLSIMTNEIIVNGPQFNPTLFLISLPYVIIYLAIAVVIFNRKDLS